MTRRDPLVVHGVLVGLVSAAAVTAVVAFTPVGAKSWAGQLGVWMAVVSGVGSLLLKRMAQSTKAAIAVVGLVFGARMILVVAGSLWAARAWNETMVFIVAFFGTYFPLQWVEISFLLAEAKRRGQTKEQE